MEPNQYINYRRHQLGLSLAQLAAKLSEFGYHAERQTISHWEKGRNNPPIDDRVFRQALARALEVDVNTMMSQMGFIVNQSDRSPEALLGADLIDSMPPDKRRLAVGILEQLAEG